MCNNKLKIWSGSILDKHPFLHVCGLRAYPVTAHRPDIHHTQAKLTLGISEVCCIDRSNSGICWGSCGNGQVHRRVINSVTHFRNPSWEWNMGTIIERYYSWSQWVNSNFQQIRRFMGVFEGFTSPGRSRDWGLFFFLSANWKSSQRCWCTCQVARSSHMLQYLDIAMTVIESWNIWKRSRIVESGIPI
jgi:hypothetical protein